MENNELTWSGTLKRAGTLIQDHNGKLSTIRVLSYFAMAEAMHVSHDHATSQNITTILLMWLVFILLCNHVVKVIDIIKFKNGNGNENQNTPASAPGGPL